MTQSGGQIQLSPHNPTELAQWGRSAASQSRA